MQYQLIRSKRSSISLQVIAGKIVVRAPLRVKEDYIDKLLVNKSAWIQEKVTQQLFDKSYQNQLCVGGQIWFDGKLCPLEINYGPKNITSFDGNNLQLIFKASKGSISHSPADAMEDKSTVLEVPSQLIKKRIEAWLKQQAQDYLIPRTHHYSQQMLLTPKAISIRQYKARWGSCNSLRNIQFNYLLMMAPKWVIDYVIVHELCHLKHLNHSRQFWQLTAKYSPNYLLAKQWLKKHQHKLQWATQP